MVWADINTKSGRCDLTSGECSLGDLQPCENVMRTFSGEITADATATIGNTVAVATLSNETSISDIEASVSGTVQAPPVSNPILALAGRSTIQLLLLSLAVLLIGSITNAASFRFKNEG